MTVEAEPFRPLIQQTPDQDSTGPSVHIVDDDKAVCQAISFLLRSTGHPVAIHSSGLAFLAAISGLDHDRIGCVLTDVRMPKLDGIALLRRLRDMNFGRPVIVMTAHGDIATAVQAMKAGAMDFLEKPFDDDTLIALVEAALVVREQNPINAHTESSVKSQAEAIEAVQRMNLLSSRERDVLKLLVAGKPNKLVAYELGISQRTAEVHRARMMARLGVHSLAEAVRLAVKAELVGDH